MKQPLQILLLDDDSNDAGLMARRLRDIAVLTVVDRRALFESALADKSWDCIIADYRLSDIRGDEAIQIAHEKAPEVPVILVSGSLHDGEAVSVACQYGAVDCLTKDRLDRLKMAVERANERHQSEIERRKLEKERLRDQRLESLGSLATGISHDMRNVLGAMMMGIEQLHGKDLSDDKNRILDAMMSACKRGTEMVAQLLAFARGRNGGSFKPVATEYVLGEIGQMLRSGAFPANIRSNVRVEPGTSKMLCDVTQIHQCLLNLAINSRDAMPGGGEIRVSAQNRTLDNESLKGSFVVISVQDTGTGIPKDVFPNIFTPFYTTKGANGTGMGLAIVKSIMLAHGGDVEVATGTDGTEFNLYVPSVGHDGVAMGMERTEPPQTGKTVLLVDDQEFIRDIASQLIEDAGYSVITCSNGPEALAAFKVGKQIDVVLTDISMPLFSGKELAKNLRELGFTKPIILMSGFDSETADASLPVLEKPFTRERLLNVLKDVLTSST